MSSIFGKCIAIAMMAAIALVWQSPPAHADGIDDAKDNRDAARAASDAADDAAENAEDYAETARDDADAAEEAADDAKEAAKLARTAGEADAAEEAAEEANQAKYDADAEADAAEAAETAAEAAMERANIAKRNAEIIYLLARTVARSDFGLGDDDDADTTTDVTDAAGIVARYNTLNENDDYDVLTTDSSLSTAIASAVPSGGNLLGDRTGNNAVSDDDREAAIEAYQVALATLIKTDWLDADPDGAVTERDNAEGEATKARDAAARAAAHLRVAIAAAAKAAAAAAAATAADLVTKDQEYADAIAAAAADPTDADKAVDEVEAKQAAADAAKAAADAAEANEEYNPTPVVCEDGMMRNADTNMCEAITCADGEELVGNECMTVCGEDMTRDADGMCMLNACAEGMERIDGAGECVAVCGEDMTRDADGMCMLNACAEGMERIDGAGACVAVCGDDMERIDGTCEAVCGDEMTRDADTGMCEFDACAEGMERDEDGMCMNIPMADVTANGVGNLLKFGYWTTMGKDTLVAVTNLGKAQETVTVKVMDEKGMAAGSISVCLDAGDTWTSAITSSGEAASSVIGGSPGGCSGAMADTALSATYGFIEAYPADGEGYLMGIATVVNPVMGYASSYNATSLNVFDAEGEAKKYAIMDALAMEGGIQKDMLLGRWGALKAVGGMTQLVLSFPVPGSAPMEQVAIEVTDEMGNSEVVASMLLNKAVNMCTFATDAMDATTLSCNGSQGFPVASDQGWFKIMAPDDMGFPAIGMVGQSFDGTLGMFDQSYPVQWMEMHDTDDMDMME